MIRKPQTEEEKEFWEKAYAIGMDNEFCSGEEDLKFGNVIAEKDRLNKDSIIVVDKPKELKEVLGRGNHCLGYSIMYKTICFINQVKGKSEFLVIKKGENGDVFSFESWNTDPMLEFNRFDYALRRILKTEDSKLKRY